MRRIMTSLTTIAAAALLAACATAPAPEPDSAPDPDPTPTPTETEAPPAVAEIALLASALELRDDAGAVLESFDFLADGGDIVASVTAALGSDPEEVPYPGHIEARPGTDYTWPGLVVRVQDFEPQPDISNLTYIVSAPESGDVALVGGPEAVQVGDTLAGFNCPGFSSEPFEAEDGTTQRWGCVDQAPAAAQDPAPGQVPALDFVGVRLDPSDVVLQLTARVMNYGV